MVRLVFGEIAKGGTLFNIEQLSRKGMEILVRLTIPSSGQLIIKKQFL